MEGSDRQGYAQNSADNLVDLESGGDDQLERQGSGRASTFPGSATFSGKEQAQVEDESVEERQQRQLRTKAPDLLRMVGEYVYANGAKVGVPAQLANKLANAMERARRDAENTPCATVATVGRSGAGKSRLLNAVVQECVAEAEVPTNARSESRLELESSQQQRSKQEQEGEDDVPRSAKHVKASTPSSIPTCKRRESVQGRREAFLLPEGDVLDTTSVGYTVRLGREARVRLVYCSPGRAARHLGLLRALPKMKPAERDSPSIQRAAQRALAMAGFSPSTAFKSIDPNGARIPEDLRERLGNTLVYEPPCSVGVGVEGAIERLAKFLDAETVGEKSHWGLLDEVQVEVPAERQWRGVEFVDAPGAGEGDAARGAHLKEALGRACAVVIASDARPLDADVSRALADSGFLCRLLRDPDGARLIVATVCDRVLSSRMAELRKGGPVENYLDHDEFANHRVTPSSAATRMEERLQEARHSELAELAEYEAGASHSEAHRALSQGFSHIPMYTTWSPPPAGLEGKGTNLPALLRELRKSCCRHDVRKGLQANVPALNCLDEATRTLDRVNNVPTSPSSEVRALQSELQSLATRLDEMKEDVLLAEYDKEMAKGDRDRLRDELEQRLRRTKRGWVKHQLCLQRMKEAEQAGTVEKLLSDGLQGRVESISRLLESDGWEAAKDCLARLLGGPVVSEAREQFASFVSGMDIAGRLADSSSRVASRAMASEGWSDCALLNVEWLMSEEFGRELKKNGASEVAALDEGVSRGGKRFESGLVTRISAGVEDSLASTSHEYFQTADSSLRRQRVTWRLELLSLEGNLLVESALWDISEALKEGLREVARPIITLQRRTLKRVASRLAAYTERDVRASFEQAMPGGCELLASRVLRGSLACLKRLQSGSASDVEFRPRFP